MRSFRILLTAAMLSTFSAAAIAGAELEPLLKTLRAVGPKGAGHREAARAWQELVRAPAAELPTVLAALDGAEPLAANWIRTAVDSIAQGELRRGGKLPAAELERFVLDTQHVPRARRLAYEWLRYVDRSAPERLVPKMLDDPSLEMRRDAVAELIDEASALAAAEKNEQALPVYQRAFTAARDLDQVKLLAERLRKLDQKVDLPRHFGFLLGWKLIGPFGNTDEKGYDVVYPPELQLDFAASYDGKHGKIKWIDHLSSDDHGKVDFNAVFAEEKAVIAYATTEFHCERQQDVQFRTTSGCAVKLWLNGRLIAEHNIYHAGSHMDQYVTRATLRPGKNVISIKICQNEQTQSWAKPWAFQLRVCPRDGTAVLSTDRKP